MSFIHAGHVAADLKLALGTQNFAKTFSNLLLEDSDFSRLPASLQIRGTLIHDVVWKRLAKGKVIRNWTDEYIIPMLLVSFGLLAHLDNARNQPGFIALVLSAAQHITDTYPELAVL